MCFYLALKVYILYSFFCTTFPPPGSDGQRVLLRWQGCWFRHGAERAAPASRFPTHVVSAGRTTGIAKLPLPSQPPTCRTLQQFAVMGQLLETLLGVGVNRSPLLRDEFCSQGAQEGLTVTPLL